MERNAGADLGTGYEAQCQACDGYGPVDDIGLCASCSEKIDRDFIRLRDWDYSASAFGLPPSARETLRDQVIARHGKKLELLAEADETRSKD